jgi:hypothetical protein
MDAAETARARREILEGLEPLLRGELAAEHWGRALIEVVRVPGGGAVVAGIDVDEIVGNEGHVDAVFGRGAVRGALPVLAMATEALCALDAVELEDVRGGTFVRLPEGFAWLPGLVRAPSPRLDRERDELVARLREKNAALRVRFPGDRVELDVDGSVVRWWAGDRPLGESRATVVGTFAHAPRTWAWAFANENAPAAVRRASQALLDGLVERDLWELTSPAFPTDESTVWALAAYLCDRTKAEGVQRMAGEEGALFVLLQGVRSL